LVAGEAMDQDTPAVGPGEALVGSGVVSADLGVAWAAAGALEEASKRSNYGKKSKRSKNDITGYHRGL